METIPWRFTDKEMIAFSGQDRVPVLVDAGKVLAGSWTIANYLEQSYRDSPFAFWRTGRAGTSAFR